MEKSEQEKNPYLINKTGEKQVTKTNNNNKICSVVDLCALNR